MVPLRWRCEGRCLAAIDDAGRALHCARCRAVVCEDCAQLDVADVGGRRARTVFTCPRCGLEQEAT